MSENENREIKKTSAAENLMQLMSFTAEQAKELANANSVLGEKMEFGDVTVIPVSKISAGFAGGGASFINATQKKSQTPSGSGAKVTVTPDGTDSLPAPLTTRSVLSANGFAAAL